MEDWREYERVRGARLLRWSRALIVAEVIGMVVAMFLIFGPFCTKLGTCG